MQYHRSDAGRAVSSQRQPLRRTAPPGTQPHMRSREPATLRRARAPDSVNASPQPKRRSTEPAGAPPPPPPQRAAVSRLASEPQVEAPQPGHLAIDGGDGKSHRRAAQQGGPRRAAAERAAGRDPRLAAGEESGRLAAQSSARQAAERQRAEAVAQQTKGQAVERARAARRAEYLAERLAGRQKAERTKALLAPAHPAIVQRPPQQPPAQERTAAVATCEEFRALLEGEVRHSYDWRLHPSMSARVNVWLQQKLGHVSVSTS